HAPADRKGNADEGHQAVTQRVEEAVEQHQDHGEADRDDDRQALLGLLQLLELAGPCNAVAVRKLYVPGDPLLRFGDRAAEIATAHAELDRNEALVALVIDVGRSGIEGDIGELPQRNIGVGAGWGLESDLDIAHGFDVVAVFRSEPHGDVELAIGLEQCRRGRAGQRRLDDVVDVAGVEAVAGCSIAIDLDVQIGLAENRKDSEVRHPLHPCHLFHDLAGNSLQRRQVTTNDLDRVGAFDPGQAFLDVVLDILREIKADAGELLGEFGLQIVDQLFLGHSTRPFLERLERHEQLDVVEARRVAAVVGAAMLGYDRDDLRMAEHHLAKLVHDRHSRLERYRRRHRGTDPQVSFLERRQEFGAEPRHQQADDGQKGRADRDHGLAVRERPAQDRDVSTPQRAHDNGFGLPHVLGKQVGGEDRGDREGRDQRPDQGVAVRPRHRIEDLALDALHGEQRDERRYRDGGGEKHRLVDLQRAREDHAQAIGPGAIRRAGRIGAESSLRQFLQELPPSLRRRLEISKYVPDQDHRRIDDDTEIDGADGQEIGVLPAQHQDDDAEEQRKRDIDPDDDGAA